MRTTPALIARLAAEIESRFRGARVTDVGVLVDGRTVIALHGRRETHLLCLDIFGTPPLVTVEDGELPIAAEPGFIRALGAALRGSTLVAAKARKGDRLLRLTFGTRSRFGVGDEVDVYVELVPRFGNVILVKRDTVVAAAKEFSLAENPARTTLVGMPYALPPLFAREQAGAEADDADTSVLSAMRSHRDRTVGNEAASRTSDRRRALLRRLEARETRVRGEIAKLDAKRSRAEAREALRDEGDAIFARLHELDETKRDEAKERATKLFAQYKKLGASIPHIEDRHEALATLLRSIDELRWEAERAGESELDDVERTVAAIDGRTATTSTTQKRRKRAPLEVRTALGSRILIGRSPAENAELTFHVARPNDLWFHAQNMPGAHVILQRDDRSAPSDEDVARAASLAAFYSKGKASAKVPIDYTERKYVRAQRNAMAGLVWYTNPRTIMAEPRDEL